MLTLLRGNVLIIPVSAFMEGGFKKRVKNMLNGRRYSALAGLAAVIVVIIAGVVLLTSVNNISENDNSAATVTTLVEGFGKKLQAVSLLAPAEIVSRSIQESYGDYVSPDLLAEWKRDPQKAPGRIVSSPWPDRIEILDLEKLSESGYAVKGEVIEITSVELLNGGVAAKRPIALQVEKFENRWLITFVKLGEYAEANSDFLTYSNVQYGFVFSLPGSWHGYSLVNSAWEGFTPGGTAAIETGPLISIRHPQWTDEDPRQDIPIMIFTLAQWNALQQGEFHIGAAPVGPKELGRNSQYVFALPARYNYSFPTGFEEVEKILESNPLQGDESKYR